VVVRQIPPQQQRRYDTKLLHFIVDKHLPLDSTDNVFFKDWLLSFAPTYEIPSRWYITNDLMHARYSVIHQVNKSRIEGLDDVGINVDGWEDEAKRSLYAIIFICRGERSAICDLISAPCYLHWLGNLIRDILAHQNAKVTVKRNNELVRFFNASHFWGHELRAWQKENGVARWLRTTVETRWYSIGHNGASE